MDAEQILADVVLYAGYKELPRDRKHPKCRIYKQVDGDDTKRLNGDDLEMRYLSSGEDGLRTWLEKHFQYKPDPQSAGIGGNYD